MSNANLPSTNSAPPPAQILAALVHLASDEKGKISALAVNLANQELVQLRLTAEQAAGLGSGDIIAAPIAASLAIKAGGAPVSAHYQLDGTPARIEHVYLTDSRLGKDAAGHDCLYGRNHITNSDICLRILAPIAAVGGVMRVELQPLHDQTGMPAIAAGSAEKVSHVRFRLYQRQEGNGFAVLSGVDMDTGEPVHVMAVATQVAGIRPGAVVSLPIHQVTSTKNGTSPALLVAFAKGDSNPEKATFYMPPDLNNQPRIG